MGNDPITLLIHSLAIEAQEIAEQAGIFGGPASCAHSDIAERIQEAGDSTWTTCFTADPKSWPEDSDRDVLIQANYFDPNWAVRKASYIRHQLAPVPGLEHVASPFDGKRYIYLDQIYGINNDEEIPDS